MDNSNEPTIDPQDLTPEADLDKLSDDLAVQMADRFSRKMSMTQLIREGLAPDGKKLRRNARCPCGSDKKFKNCCLAPMKAKTNAKLQRKLKKRTPDKESTPDENSPQS